MRVHCTQNPELEEETRRSCGESDRSPADANFEEGVLTSTRLIA